MLNWFGDWSTGALYQVGKEFTSKIDLDNSLVSVLSVLILCIVGRMEFFAYILAVSDMELSLEKKDLEII